MSTTLANTITQGTTITNTIRQRVTLGSAGFLNPLTITSTGAIEPTASGATGLYVPTTGSILNQGTIAGGNGDTGGLLRYGPGQPCGTGVDLVSGGTLKNADVITGGGRQVRRRRREYSCV